MNLINKLRKPIPGPTKIIPDKTKYNRKKKPFILEDDYSNILKPKMLWCILSTPCYNNSTKDACVEGVFPTKKAAIKELNKLRYDYEVDYWIKSGKFFSK